MESWRDIRAHLREKFPIIRDDEAGVAIAWPVPVEDREVRQGVGLSPNEVHGRPWLEMVADLFPEASLSHQSAVLYQDRLPLGTLVVRNGVYLLRHGLARAGLTADVLDWTIRVVVHEAVRLRINLKAKAPPGDAFTNYAE